MVRLIVYYSLPLLWFAGFLPLLRADPLQNQLEDYDVIWTTPSNNSAGSMPIGNGEVGLNVWVESDGDLRAYISRSDSYSEICRQLKVGAFRLKITPNPFQAGRPFLQHLHLRDGILEIQGNTPAGPVTVNIWIDADQPVIHLTGAAAEPVQVRFEVESWRKESHTLTGGEAESAKTMRGGPYPLTESGDVFSSNSRQSIWWYHRNEDSCVPYTLKHQGVESLASLVSDPLLHRTFGALASADLGMQADGNTALQSTEPLRQFDLRIATQSAITDTADDWLTQVSQVDQKSKSSTESRQRTARWWNDFWNRSWIFVKGDTDRIELPKNNHPLRIGANSEGGNAFSGEMSRFSLFSRVLTSQEISELAATKPDQELPNASGATLHQLFQDSSSLACAQGKVSLSPDHDIRHATFSGGFLEYPSADWLDFPNGFTFESWINPATSTSEGRLVDKMTPFGSDGFLIDTYPGNALRLISGQDSLSTDPILRPGQWQHVAVTYDPEGNVRKLYLNGILQKSEGHNETDSSHAPPSKVTRAFILQRWMLACAGRGAYPIKYNGSIFTVDPASTDPKETYNPDWRRWGDGFWWQNTRLPYGPMVMDGDYDLMRPLFSWFENGMAFSKARTKLYWGADGFTIPETSSIFYTYSNEDYGWNRDGQAPGDIDSNWWRYCWQQSLELTNLMLDYYEHTGDTKFLHDELIPVARETLLYFDTRFKRDDRGKLVLDPTQSAESYWHDVVNDMPAVAGLNTVPDRLITLAGQDASPEDLQLWQRMKACAPSIPLHEKNGKSCLSPAERYNPSRNNCENPELYAVFPFHVFSVGRPNLEVAVNAWEERDVKVAAGWPYDSQSAALLGLTDSAERELMARVGNSHPNFRFPVMWGPNFDWLPDQCHGGNLMMTLQSMVMQTDGRKIYLLPAWPKTWDVEFKLHAPYNTIVEGHFTHGKITNLQVTPAERQSDVIFMSQ